MKRLLSLILVLALLAQPASVFAAKQQFQDVKPGAWYEPYIDYVCRQDLMQGTSRLRFSPDEAMTRAMLVTVLHRMEGKPESTSAMPFRDIRPGAYYEAAVAWAYENGIVNGVSENRFAPDEPVTREQIVTILFRFAAWQGRDTSVRHGLYDYYDLVCVSDFAWEAMSWALAEGILNGSDHRLTPGESALRSQCAAILSRYLDPELALKNTPWEPPVWKEPEKEGRSFYVLMYHSVVPDGTECNDWTITAGTFRDHMKWLKEHGYTTVLPSELAAGKPLSSKAVMITFDDGYANNYTQAFPILLEFGHKAAISVVVGNMDSGHYLSWEMCRRMVSSGLVEIGSHTYALHSQPGIQRLKGESRQAYEERVLGDLQTSIDVITRELGAAPQLFAYPFGAEDAWAGRFVLENFALSVVTDSGPNDIENGLYSLLRSNVNERTELSDLLP